MANQAHRKNGKLILEIDEASLLADAVADPTLKVKIFRPEAFLAFVARDIFTVEKPNDGLPVSAEEIANPKAPPTLWVTLVQNLARQAANYGEGAEQTE